ncbi:MAG: MBL fold metallo-hydrolase [Burkholderiales bacterium]|nr:MBL fold metallo-hydrolase [Burkholderiales bacterium]
MNQGYTAPPDARLSASLLLLRDGRAGLEVLLLRRAERERDWLSGATVFPGGVLEADDREAERYVLGATDAALSARYGLPGGILELALAAVRESFEEIGLLLACDESGCSAAPTPAWDEWRQRLQRREATLAEACQALGLRLDLRRFFAWSHWLTPPGTSRRFDTRFFVTAAPASQVAQADQGEAVELMWLPPDAALDPQRGFKLFPVTRRTLRQLSAYGSVEEALAAATRLAAPIPRVMPRHARTRQGPTIILPDHLAYAEVCKLDPDGLAHDALTELVAGQPVRLSPRVLRVTAPNPGVMTGPGTNSYFVGDPDADSWALIDPGPADPVHLQALRAAAPGRVRWVLATHTHRDHSPGAAAAAQAFGAIVLGRRPAHERGQDTEFAPTREPVHGERLLLSARTSLRAIHTPGHASNHLCWLLEQERLLFTGDHVMQGSTVVIDPPDGDMAAYLRSLQALLDEDLQWLAPGHGFLVAEPHAVLRALIEHRLRREAKVVEALRARGEASLDEMLPEVYADAPPRIHPVARRSLLAHLLKLRDEGRAEDLGEDRWRWLGA